MRSFGHDLAAIDRELDQLGPARPDVAALITRYAVSDGGHEPSAAAASEVSSASTARDVARGSERPRQSANPAAVDGGAPLGSQDLSDDHEEFELLVSEEDITYFEDEAVDHA